MSGGMKVEEKKRAFEEWLQCNSVEKYERYREKNVEAKRKVEEAKRMSNFKWGQDFDRSYEENKKKFWKEVRRVKKGGLRTEERVKDVNGRLLRGNEARKRWAEYFEELLNVLEDREADIVAVGGVQVPVMGEENEREITIEEVKRALNETKGGKAPGMDGVRVEMLKEGGVTVLEWLVRLFNICFMLSIVPVDWVIACMVPLYKGKGDMYECSNFRGISLLRVVGKVYGRVLINRIRDKTENVSAKVQGGFRRGRGCTDQIFTVRQIREKYLGKGKDVYFKNTKNLFIHIALIPEGDNPRVNPNILKCLLHSPVARGYRLVVIASRAMVCKTPTYYLILNSLAFARGCVILQLTHSLSSFAYFAFISSYLTLIILSEVL